MIYKHVTQLLAASPALHPFAAKSLPRAKSARSLRNSASFRARSSTAASTAAPFKSLLQEQIHKLAAESQTKDAKIRALEAENAELRELLRRAGASIASVSTGRETLQREREVVAAATAGKPSAEQRGVLVRDYEPTFDSAIGGVVGDEVVVLTKLNVEWWKCRRVKDGTEGCMPASFVKLLLPPPAEGVPDV